MNQPLRLPRIAPTPPAGTAGLVIGAESSSWRVRSDGGVIRAERAPSCLLEPEVGDEVWLLPAESGPVIAAVLRRAEGGAARIVLPGDRSAVVANELSLSSERALELDSREAVRVRGPAFEVTARRTRVASEAVALVADRVEAGLRAARVAAETVDAALDSLAMRLKRSFRWIDELEQVRAGQLDLRASGHARVHGDSAVVSADRIVQVRGEEVHLS